MQTLGVENYGIINAVGGFVAMFSLISGSLTAACQRYITFELGKKDGDIRQVFSSTFAVQVLLSIVLIVVAETIGLYFVNHKLNIPDGKFIEAQWVYQVSVISFVLNLLNMPYNALIVAHERMKVFAYISLIEAVFKFVQVVLLIKLPYNTLICYSVLGLIFATIIRIIYQRYCIHAFKGETKLKRNVNWGVFRNIFGFAGWSFIGNTATILSNQGVNIVLNIFKGVTLNAARGVASMVESTISSFVYNFTTALNPQITKSYAKGDIERLTELITLGIRISFYLMALMAIPVSVVTPDVLQVWLGVYPDYAVPFIRITLVIAVVHAIANPFLTTVLATGDIRTYQIIVGGITLLNLPAAYFILKFGSDPIYVYVSALIVYLITFIIRMVFVHNKANVPMGGIVKTILLQLIPIAILGLVISFVMSALINTTGLFGLILYAAGSCSGIAIIVYLLGVSSSERKVIHAFVNSKIRKKK